MGLRPAGAGSFVATFLGGWWLATGGIGRSAKFPPDFHLILDRARAVSSRRCESIGDGEKLSKIIVFPALHLKGKSPIVAVGPLALPRQRT